MKNLNDYEIVDIPKEGCKKCVLVDVLYCRHVFKWLTGYYCDYKMLVKKVKFEQCTRDNTKAGDTVFLGVNKCIVHYIFNRDDKMLVSIHDMKEICVPIGAYKIKVED